MGQKYSLFSIFVMTIEGVEYFSGGIFGVILFN